MNISEIRELSLQEMQNKLDELKEGLFNFRFQHGTKRLDSTAKLRQTKRDIAQIKTVINELRNK